VGFEWAGGAFGEVVGAGEVEGADGGHGVADEDFESGDVGVGNLEAFLVELPFGVWLDEIDLSFFDLVRKGLV